MLGLSTYFATSSPKDYVDQLFGRAGPSAPGAQEISVYRPPSFDSETGTTATDRALARIVSIIWDMEHGGETQETAVEQSGGYILNARGSDAADTIDMKAISAFDISSGDGDDSVTIKAGTVAALDAGAGNDIVNLSAGYLAEIAGGDGDDKIHLVGDLADAVHGGAGNDEIKISAEAMLGVDGGDGDDTFYLEGRRIFARGGAGNDTFGINRKGDGVAELSFGRGDGKDVVNTNGPIEIRLAPGASGLSSTLAPEDLDLAVSDNRLVLRVKDSGDMITVNFEKGALEGAIPRYSFELDGGAYVLRVD